MGNGSSVSRVDRNRNRNRNRNRRLARLRALVPVTAAIVGVDLADKKQMVVVTDRDSKVRARKTFRCRAWDPAACQAYLCLLGLEGSSRREATNCWNRHELERGRPRSR
jgi:hypothetical protein